MNKKVKQAFSWLAAVSLLAGSLPGGMTVQAAEVGAAQLAENNTAAPEAWGALPSPNQYRYQKEELAAFCHFGPNTFNEVEWGESYGNREPADIFRLANDFDAETLVKTLQEAGFKKLIVTAKHHDGFCIWASDYTTYDVASTNYKQGNGDILAEISAACTKYNMDMGLYLSPWDIHEPSYGYYDANGNATTAENDVLDYNEHYNNQLQEILGNEKYGNNGHFVEVWMDGAKGSGANAQEYDFQTWFATIQAYEGKEAGYDDDCMLFGAQAYTTVRWIGNELGFANEETWSKSTVDYGANTINSNQQTVGGTGYTVGVYNGNKWTVPEADARITSGWFWGTTKCTPKSLADLGEMYFRSVGHNAPLLLNVPPNNQGTVDTAILNRVKEFGQNIKDSFDVNLAANATVTASEVRGNDVAFSPANVIDGDDTTYWTMSDDTTTGSLTLDLGGTKTFDLVTIEEAIQLGQRISSFSVEYQADGGEWQTFAEGTTIGAKRICRDAAVRADKVRINITGSYAVPLISEVGLYKASEDFEISSPIIPGLEVISVTDTDVSDGKGFTYTGWTAQSGSEFIEGNSMWANSGAEATLKFTGTKVWLYGTKDPSHGTADIYIDGNKVDTINTNAGSRSTGQEIYESADLSDGEHTLRIVNTGTGSQQAIGLDAAAVLNNGGKGMVEFEKKNHEMEEDSTDTVLLKRVGGSTGEISVTYENNPGSAVQGHYDVNGIQGTIVFADGEKEKEIPITTKRYDQETGDLNFTVDLNGVQGGALLGRNTRLNVVIHDLDDSGRIAEAREILTQAQTMLSNTAEGTGIERVRSLAKELNAYLENSDVIAVSDIILKARELKSAMEQVEVTSAFVLPVGEEVKTIEAEAFTLDASEAADKVNKYVRITERSDASGGKEVNWFENGNKIRLAFHAPKAGTYQVTATYRSGRSEGSPNAFEWSGTNVTAGSLDVYGPDANVFKTATFDIVVTQAGEGELVFTASSKAGPVIDKFVIECKDKTPVTTVAVTGVTLDKESISLTAEKPYATLVETITPANATNQNVTFTSSDTTVATVDENGLVRGVPGALNKTATITVTTEDGNKTAECQVTVNCPAPVAVSGVTVTPTEATLTQENPEVTLQAVVAPEDAANKKVTYSSSAPEIASVDANGKVKGLKKGEAVITVTTEDGAKTAECRITVDFPEVSVFVLPVGDEVKTVEAEAFTLDASEAADKENKYVRITTRDDASGGKEVNWFENGNKIKLAFDAPAAGTYQIKATYRSGRDQGNPNAFNWGGTNVTSGSQDVYGEAAANIFHTVQFTINVTAAGPGELVFTADSKGGPVIDKFEFSCKETTPVTVAVTGVTLTPANVTLTNENPEATLSAVVAPENATNKNVTYSSSDTTVATVDASGKVKGVKTGTATITVTTEDGNKTAECQVTVDMPTTPVTVAVTGVTLTPANVTLTNENPEATLSAVVAPENATNKNVTYSSSDTTVATVDASGKVKGVKTGTATITVTTEDGNKTAECQVTVDMPTTPVTVAVTGVTLTPANVTLTNENPEATLNAVVAPENATNKNVTYSSSDTTVATVDASGKVKGVKTGTATITVTTEDGNKTAVCQVTVDMPTVPVTVAVTGVTLTPANVTLTNENPEATLNAVVAPENATNKNVTYSSSDTTVATVDASGKVKGVKTGTATITVTTEDGNKTAVCQVTVDMPTAPVTVAVTGVTLTPANVTLTNENPEATLNAVVAPENATNKNVTYSSSDTTVATVDASGKVKGVKTGTATITVTTEDGNKTAVCQVTVDMPTAPVTVAVTGVTLTPANVTLTNENPEATLNAVVAPENATNKNVTYSSSDTTVATVDASGKVKGVKTGTATITVTTEDGNKTAECQVTVTFKNENPAEEKLEELNGELKELEAVITAGKGNYTDETWNKLVKAYNSAKAVDEKTDLAVIAQCLKDLQDAKATLQVKQPDPTPVNPDPTPVNPDPTPVNPVKIEVNKVYDSGNYYYKVTSVSEKTAQVTGLKKKDITKIVIYNTVTLGGQKFNVTSVAPSAFKGNKKITSVTVKKGIQDIGANAFASCPKLKKVTIKSTTLKNIGAKAFYNCKKLKSVVIKSKVLKKIGKNAFKGINKKAVFRVPASKLKAYKKTLTKAGLAKTAKIKK